MSSTATHPGLGIGPAVVPGWALLAMDELWLALPQRDLRRFELAADLEAPDPALKQAVRQFISDADEGWPVYNLDGSLKLLSVISGTRSLCAFLRADGRTRGLLCDRVWTLAKDADLVVEPMPGCIKAAPSPATGLARFQDRIAMVTSGTALSSYLDHLLEQDYVECEN